MHEPAPKRASAVPRGGPKTVRIKLLKTPPQHYHPSHGGDEEVVGWDDTVPLEASRRQGPKPVEVDGLRSSSERPAGGGCEHER